MFDLEREVLAWSRKVHADPARVEELSDHLYCEIERARAEGMADEAAFRAAVAKLGPAPQLAAEHAKNRPLLRRIACAVVRAERSGSSRELAGLLIAHALLWAALMIAASLLTKGAVREASGWLVPGVLVPGWWASEQLLRWAARPQRKAGA